MLAEGIGFSTVIRKEAGEAQPAETGLGVNPSDNHPEEDVEVSPLSNPAFQMGQGAVLEFTTG